MNHDSNEFLIAGNWKMNGSSKLFQSFLAAFDKNIDGVNILICPPFTLLGMTNSGVFSLGAQNVSADNNGAFTGEVSAAMLSDSGCEYVIVGHSERREYQSEGNQLIAKKLRKSLDAGLKPILCVGESEETREGGLLVEFLKGQLSEALKDLSADDLKKVIVAYEPIWAIGTGKAASVDQVREVHLFIRNYLRELNEKVGQTMPILYGGSVKPSNASELFDIDDVNGALVGGASLEPQMFKEICLKASEKR